jgi:uncharacterized protein YbaP (TraB family)
MKYFILTFIYFHVTSAMTQLVRPENKLLWEISGNGLSKKSYLFGSLHSNDRRIFNFSDSTYIVLQKSEGIVLETDLFSLFGEWDTRQEEVKLLFDNKGKPYTANGESTVTIYGDENGMPQFMDAHFQEYCYNANKKFYALEKVKDQLKMMSDWGQSEKDGLRLDPMAWSQEKLIEFYLKGDIMMLDRMMKANLSLSPGMYDEIIIARNQTMVKGLDSIIRSNSVFCAVGAGHLAGELGMINLLRSNGYKLRPVLATFTEKQLEAKAAIKDSRSFTFFHKASGLVVNFPGKPKEMRIWDNHPFLIYREMGQGNTYSVEIIPSDSLLTLVDQAAIYIASPNETFYECSTLDDGTNLCEGVGDTYPEGPHWIRLIQSDKYLVIMKAYGGNKFMNSNRPELFFNRTGFE